MEVLNDEIRAKILMEKASLLSSCELWIDSNFVNRVYESLHELEQEFPFIYSFINSNISHIVLLKTTKTAFSSATFQETPNTIFLTKLSLGYLPPSFCFLNNYSLKENIFHEALHQDLFKYSTFNEVIQNEYYDKLIYIPWRSESWSLLKVIHAYYVYSNVSIMRYKYLNEVNLTDLALLIDKAKSCAQLLYDELKKSEFALTNDGISFISKTRQFYEESFRK